MEQILSSSRLNKLALELRLLVTFYAELERSLDYKGIEPASFARVATSTAIWADGTSHAVPANGPRYESAGGKCIGLLIDKTTETLQFSAANKLDSATRQLCWLEAGEAHFAPSEPAPFNASGQWIGAVGHIRQIVQFSRVLTAGEQAQVAAVITAPGHFAFGRLTVPAGTEEIDIPHGLGYPNPIISGVPTWETRFWIVDEQPTYTRVQFAALDGGLLHWEAEI